MNPEKKSKYADKLSQPAKPIITQVVPVVTKPAATYTNQGKDHFNLYTEPEDGKALRLLKAETGRTVQDMLEEALLDFLRKMGK